MNSQHESTGEGGGASRDASFGIFINDDSYQNASGKSLAEWLEGATGQCSL